MAGFMTLRDAERESQHTTYEVMHCIFSGGILCGCVFPAGAHNRHFHHLGQIGVGNIMGH